VRARYGTVLAWSLYELGATSFAMNLLSLHLPLDIARRVPRGSEKFSLAFGLSMAVVAVAAPFLGHLADRAGKRRFLVPFVLAGVAFTALVAAPGPVPRVLVLFALANIAFQCAYVFYNALLPDVSDETNSGRVSGWGVAAGYLGSLLGMFLVLPFVSGKIRAGMPSFVSSICDALSVAAVSSNANDAWVRQNAYLPTALLWLGAAVPLLFFARLPRPSSLSKKFSSSSSSSSSPSSPLRDVLATIRSLPSTPSLLWFLVSNFLYIDVIHTIQIQMATYSRYAVGLNDTQVQILLLVATAVAILGGLLYGFLCQRVTIRAATLVALGNWALVFALALLVRDPKAFTVVGVLAGIGLGGIKVTGRLGLIALVPKERMTEFFGFFTLAGEAAAVLGPFLWAATLTLFPDKSPTGYRAGISVLLVVLVFAIGAFLRVQFPRAEAAVPLA
jgi:UMF1 family MFS transporter